MIDREQGKLSPEEALEELHRIRALREKYFPHSFIYEGREIAENVKPWYRVTASSQEELDLARNLQPANVRAEFVLTPAVEK